MVPRSIVVPLDGSPLAERAVAVAHPLARRLGATMTLVTTRWLDDSRPPRAYLDSVAAFLGEGELETVLDEKHGAVEAIQHAVDDRPGSILCITTHGRGRFRWAMLGSTAEAVIKASGDPVLVVGPRGEPTWARTPGGVVVCVDDLERGKAAVMHACEWAAALAVDMTILSVTHPLDPTHFVDVQDAHGQLATLVRAQELAVHTEIVESSFIAGSLADFADEAFSSLLVMATHGRHGLARLALGSVTMGVLNSASCPVLVIPPGAAAPVLEIVGEQ